MHMGADPVLPIRASPCAAQVSLLLTGLSLLGERGRNSDFTMALLGASRITGNKLVSMALK